MNAQTKVGNRPSGNKIDDERWTAVVARDARADTEFVYAVKTTGVYCRPSSSARLPNRSNVRFFDSPDAARAAGYRASRRATPDQTAAAARRVDVVAKACQLINSAESQPTLSELAAMAGMSSFHFHRLFRTEMGLTPKPYATAVRAQRLRTELGESQTVTNALYDAGFNSNSSFYEASTGMLGMLPSDYRHGGRHAEIRFAVGECSLGAILVAQSQKGICAILLGEDAEQLVRDLQDQFPKARLIGGDGDFEKLVSHVIAFVEVPTLGLDLPLDLRGTGFQERVWQAVREIPAGTTVSYTDIAQRLGSPKAVRAVAQACGANRIAVAIPCHRVVRRDGDLSGYRWRVERKRELLKREA